MSEIEVIDSGVMSASASMAQDVQEIEHLAERKKPLLRFYEWQAPSITYGYFIDEKKYLKKEVFSSQHPFSKNSARRPTGGGLIFHFFDFSFTFSLPSHHVAFSENVSQNYKLVNEASFAAVSQVIDLSKDLYLEQDLATSPYEKFCMASPTRYDLMLGTKKIGGSAQRKTKHGFLHQGTIFLKLPPWSVIEQALIDGPEIVAVMKEKSFGIFSEISDEDLKKVRAKLQTLLQSELEKALSSF